MRTIMVLALSLAADALCGQCPVTPLHIQGTHCSGDSLWLLGSSHAGRIDWYLDGQLVKTASGSDKPAPETIVAGGNGIGQAANQFWFPGYIDLDSKGNLYVADLDNDRLQRFPPGSTGATNGTTVVPLPNSQNLFIGFVTAVYVDDQGVMYVNQAGDIYKYVPGAGAGQKIATTTPDLGTGTLGQISAFWLDAANNLYIPEAGNNRVQKWAPGSTSGITVAGGNGAGAAASQLNAPQGVFVDQAGNLYIADVGNNRIQKWAPGAVSGITIAGGNGAGDGASQLNHPTGLCVDASGNLYVADLLNHRIQWWPPGAAAGVTVMGGNGMGDALDQLAEPTDVKLGPDGYLYVCDDSNQRVVRNLPQPVYAIDTMIAPSQAGVYTAVVTGLDGCVVTSESFTVLATTTIGVAVAAAPVPVCSSDSVICRATADVVDADFGYTWRVNGNAVGGSGPEYIYRQPVNNDIISVRVQDPATCVSGSGETVGIVVNPSPVIATGQVFSMQYGSSVKLDPSITGTISQYSWSPLSGLSDAGIRDPMANPETTTYYTLSVMDADGCPSSALIKVDVYVPLRVPNAFTPNGDGHNDVFYVLGGPQGTVVHEMAIFDRWGHRVFEAKDIAPGDEHAGWTGRSGAQSLPAGSFVYMISLRLPNGQRQDYKGTVELIR